MSDIAAGLLFGLSGQSSGCQDDSAVAMSIKLYIDFLVATGGLINAKQGKNY